MGWQARLRGTLGLGFVYPSDEWFLRARVPVPPLEAYDNLLPALVENGVGMTRLFLEGWEMLQADLALLGGPRQIWVTGALFAVVLREKARAFAAATVLRSMWSPFPHAFGETVTVAGLLTVDDILAALRERGPGDVIVLPDEIFRGPDGCALDGKPVAAVREATGGRIYLVTQTGTQWQVRQV